MASPPIPVYAPTAALTTQQSAVKTYMARANVSSAFDPNDPLTPIYANLVATYASKAQFANNPARSNATLIEACLRARQILYWKNSPGDCGTGTQVSASAIQTGAKSGLLAAGTLTSLASAGVFGGAAGASGIAAEVSSVAVSGAFVAATAGIGLALVPVFAILAHHKQAVAKEQGSLCEVSTFVNSGFGAVRDANVDWMTKKQYFNTITTQALGAAASVTQSGKSTCNAGCMIVNAIQALRDLFIMLYGTAPAASPIAQPNTVQVGGPTATNSQGGSSPALDGASVAEVAGLGLGAHFLGAF